MKTQNKYLRQLMAIALIGLVWACSKDETTDPGPDPAPTSFEEVIKLGGNTESFPTSRSEVTTDTLSVVAETPTEIDESGEKVTKRYICTTRSVSVTDGNGEFPLFDTNAEVIYPGALLQGKTLQETTPSPIVVKRADGTISYDLNDGNTQPFFYVDEVKKSSIQNGMNQIISGSKALPDNFDLQIVQVESEKELALEMGIKVETFAAKVKSNMSFSTDKEYNRTLVKLTQKFYAMSFDLPTSLDAIFDESVTPENLANYIQADNPATFISSVVYGRIFYMLVESTSSRQEMEAKLSATYQGVTVGVSGEVETSAFEELKEVKVKVIAYGGNGSSKLVGETNIQRIAELLDETNDIRSGLPLSYVVRSVERPDKVVGTNISTELEVVDCELKGLLAPGNYEKIGVLFEEGIGAAVQLEGTNLILYNKSGTKYAWYNVADGGETRKIFDIDDPDGPMGASTFTAIGAAIHYNTGIVYVYNEEGNKAELLRYDEPSLASNTLPNDFIGAYDQQNGNNRQWVVDEIFTDQGGNYPFAGENIGAGCMYFTYQEGPTTNFYFVKEGDRYAGYDPVTGVWGGDNLTKNWGTGNANQMPFDNISAVCLVSFSPTIKRQLFFNITGDEFTIWNPEETDTKVNQFSAPWVCGN